MTEINLSNIKKSFGFNSILNDFSMEISTYEKVGLIGQNGCGKTTLFKIINDEENIDSGTISIRKGAKIGILEQLPPSTDDKIKTREILVSGVLNYYRVVKKLRELETVMATNYSEKVLNDYSRLQNEFEKLGGYEFESKVSKICSGFKLNDELLNKPFNKLSGGEKTIVMLATLVLTEPDILLLDEPTNHLDIDTLEWFEEYLKTYKGTVVIISHDRYFLDRVVNKIILIERGKEEIFFGNYSYYLEENERRIMNEFEDFKNQQKQIAAMKSKIKQLQEFGRLAFPGGEPFFKRAASIQKRLEKLELLDKPLEQKDLPLDFKIQGRSGKDVLVAKNINLSLGNKELFVNAEFHIVYGEKVCLMGKNGSGKSSLIKTILDFMPLTSGEIKVGSNVSIGYIPQEIIFENNNVTILEYARKCFDGDETRLRSALAHFMFNGELVFKRLGTLSGGEKVRLKLFELIQKKANLLILDEPTNHIDINTRELLEEAINEYKGTVLFISHDRYFINKLAQRVLYIEEGRINSYIGNYEDVKNDKRKIKPLEDVNSKKHKERYYEHKEKGSGK